MPHTLCCETTYHNLCFHTNRAFYSLNASLAAVMQLCSAEEIEKKRIEARMKRSRQLAQQRRLLSRDKPKPKQ